MYRILNIPEWIHTIGEIMTKVSDEFWEDANWIEEHYSELASKYPDQWIAAIDKHVVSYGKDRSVVESEAMQTTDRSEFPVVYLECGNHVF